MARKGRRKSLQKAIKPIYYVFCEGETEKEYVQFLKRQYHIPIEVKAKIEGARIDQRRVNACTAQSDTFSKKDKVFLLYDLDVEHILARLKKIKGADLLVSNPSIELWFLLHLQHQKAHIKSAKCVDTLLKLNPKYKKGVLTNDFKQQLLSNQKEAIKRAKELKMHSNPSSTVYKLIEALEGVSS